MKQWLAFCCSMHPHMSIKIYLGNISPTKSKALKTQLKPISGIIPRRGQPTWSSQFLCGQVWPDHELGETK